MNIFFDGKEISPLAYQGVNSIGLPEYNIGAASLSIPNPLGPAAGGFSLSLSPLENRQPYGMGAEPYWMTSPLSYPATPPPEADQETETSKKLDALQEAFQALRQELRDIVAKNREESFRTRSEWEGRYQQAVHEKSSAEERATLSESKVATFEAEAAQIADLKTRLAASEEANDQLRAENRRFRTDDYFRRSDESTLYNYETDRRWPGASEN